MDKLTEKQEEVFQFLQKYIKENMMSPSIKEICYYFDYKSPKAASDHLQALEKKGYIKREKKKSRSIKLIDSSEIEPQNSTKKLVIAGVGNSDNPLSIFMNAKGTFEVPNSWLGKGNYFVIAVGDSGLKNEGILKGDIAICKQVSSSEKKYLVSLEKGEPKIYINNDKNDTLLIGEVIKIVRDIY